jgi:uncharacterized protein
MSDYDLAADLLLKDILQGTEGIANREQLGPMVPIRLFQALRLVGMGTAIEGMVGDGAPALVYQSGQSLGLALGGALAPKANKDLEAYVNLVHQACRGLSIGIVVVEKVDLDNGALTLRVDECVSCAGVHGAHHPICNFETGLVGGIIRAFVGVPVRAVETRCNAVGDSTCGIDIKILG